MPDDLEIENRLKERAVSDFGPVIPQTYGEAVALWGPEVIHCEPHEWDNRTTWENAVWILRRLVVVHPHARA